MWGNRKLASPHWKTEPFSLVHAFFPRSAAFLIPVLVLAFLQGFVRMVVASGLKLWVLVPLLVLADILLFGTIFLRCFVRTM